MDFAYIALLALFLGACVGLVAGCSALERKK